jgi:hypothetical protein
MNADRDAESVTGRGAGSPAGERSGNGSGSAMDAMLRQRRSDENQPAEENDAAGDSGVNDVQRSGSR